MPSSGTPIELKVLKIQKIYIEKQSIYVLFFNNIIKKYSIDPLLEKEQFQKLKNQSFFKSAKVDSGGYGISWDDDCDLSENDLWVQGELIHDRLELERLNIILKDS